MKKKSHIPSVLDIIPRKPLSSMSNGSAAQPEPSPPPELAVVKIEQAPELELPLSEQEQHLFNRHKEIIRKGFAKVGETLVEVGLALAAIREGRLYRDAYPTFEEFCHHQCEHGRRQVDRIILGAKMVKYFESRQLPAPKKPSHILPLLKLTLEDAARVWKHVQEQANLRHFCLILNQNDDLNFERHGTAKP